MYLNYMLCSLNGGLAFMSGSIRHYIWGLCESVEVLLNKYEFELYNLSSSVPESYIAQMIYSFDS